jgi:general secretion pathway protein L
MARRLARVAVTALVVVGVATIANGHLRQTSALNRLDQRIASLDGDLKVVRGLSRERENWQHQIAVIRQQKEQSIPFESILEDVTRLLPDGAWINELNVANGRVAISGFAASAAQLIKAFESSSMFRSPTFTTPVVKLADRQEEQFTVEMELER